MQKLKTISFSIAFIFGILFVGKNALAFSPVLNFSDLINGPKSGLNDGLGQGAIVTIWGNNLGSSQGNSKVYFKDSNNQVHEAAYVYYWKNANGELPGGPSDLYTYHKMQEIAFSIPSASSDGAGKIYAEVDGVKSNELDFTIRNGSIYFVDVDAVSSGNGSYSNPWKSPASYINVLEAGENGAILYLMGGTYSEEYAHTGWYSNFCMENDMSGLLGRENSFVSYPDELVVLDATGPGLRNNFRLYSDNPEYIAVSKLSLVANRDSVGTYTGWRVIGNNMNAIHEFSGSGIITTGQYQDDNPTGINILGNTLHGGSSGNKLDHAFYPSSGTDNIYFGWNYIYGNNFDAGPMISLNCNYAYEYNLVSSNVNIFNNFIDVSQYPSRAIGVFETGEGSTVSYYNNVIIGNTPSGSGTCYAMSANVVYYNNTIYNGGSNNLGSVFDFYSSLTYGHLYAPESIILKNNIIHANTNSSYYVKVSGSVPSPVQDYNLYYGIGSYNPNSGNGGVDGNAVNASPLFVNPSAGNFTLQSISPAINSGSSFVSTIVSKDFLGTSRSQGSGYDIGAFEYDENTVADMTVPSVPGGLSVR